MEIDIPIKRVRVSDILFTYSTDFLEKRNLFNITGVLPFRSIINKNGSLSFKNINFAAIAKTKYGYMAVNEQDYLTYLGDGVWSVTRNE